MKLNPGLNGILAVRLFGPGDASEMLITAARYFSQCWPLAGRLLLHHLNADKI